MPRITERSLDELLDLLRTAGLIERYESSSFDVTIYQTSSTYSLPLENARNLASRVVRALALDRPTHQEAAGEG